MNRVAVLLSRMTWHDELRSKQSWACFYAKAMSASAAVSGYMASYAYHPGRF